MTRAFVYIPELDLTTTQQEAALELARNSKLGEPFVLGLEVEDSTTPPIVYAFAGVVTAKGYEQDTSVPTDVPIQ